MTVSWCSTLATSAPPSRSSRKCTATSRRASNLEHSGPVVSFDNEHSPSKGDGRYINCCVLVTICELMLKKKVTRCYRNVGCMSRSMHSRKNRLVCFDCHHCRLLRLICPRCKELDYETFKSSSVKNKEITVTDLFACQLLQVRSKRGH